MSRQFVYYGSFASVQYFSDLFGVPDAAYSLRKLSPNSVYAGAAIRVRRSSDNTEQDINFVSSSPNAGIDTTTLLSFVGAGNGFVTTWYDQSGGGWHILQTSGGNQPIIVSSGSLILKNSLPCIEFDGSNDELLNSTTSFTSNPDYYSVFMTANSIVNNNDGVFYNIGKNNNWYAAGLGGLGTSHVLGTRLRRGGTNIGKSQNLTNNNLFIHSGLGDWQNSTNDGYFNSTLMTGTAQARSSTPNKGDIVVGNINTTSLNYYLRANMSELCIYLSNKSADRTAIESNINNYYNVF